MANCSGRLAGLTLAGSIIAVQLTALGLSEASAQEACPGDFTGFRGTETTLTCDCAEGSAVGSVWGSGPYTDDSSVCAAAQHAGVIGPKGGMVTVATSPGLDAYTGSSSNGIDTQDYGPWSGSFAFVGVAEPCPSNFTDYRGTTDAVTCNCASDSFGGSVWGSGPYTDDSSVCTAALHGGHISQEGGVITVRPAAALEAYPGSSQNGVTSNDWGPWDGAFDFK